MQSHQIIPQSNKEMQCKGRTEDKWKASPEEGECCTANVREEGDHTRFKMFYFSVLGSR